MKKGLLGFCAAFLLAFSISASAQEPCVRVSIYGDKDAEAGENAVVYVKADITADTDIQGLQVNFDYSDEFGSEPQITASVEKNTTIWETVGVSKSMLLAIGDKNNNASQIVAKLVFAVPQEAQTQYTISLGEVIAQAAEAELPVDITNRVWTIATKGGSSEDTENNEGNTVNPGNGSVAGGGDASGSIPKSDEPADKPVVQSWINPFSDVKKEDWFYDYVQYVSQNGLMNGTATSLFSPNEKLTRAMFVTVLYRSENEPKISMQNEFSDVQSGEYYEKAVLWAKENGIVNGYSETEFAPHNNITREQIATMVYRYAQYKKADMSVGENTNILSYEDFDEISEYAIPAIQWVCGRGIMQGETASTINPKSIATRAQTAAIFMRVAELKNQVVNK